MDLEIFEDMENSDLRNYIKFLLWHYRVIDAFWYINVTERFDESTADRLNEKVWGRVAPMAASCAHGSQRFIKAIQYWGKRS